MGYPVAYVGADVLGTTAGEHSGHVPPHPPCTLTGVVVEGTPKLRINGTFVSLSPHKVEEGDCCCGGGSIGTLGSNASKLRVNGVSVQHETDATRPHNGTAKVVRGNGKIQII